MATIIAELCQNHQGDRTLLKDMIQAAAASGADYIKTQTIRAEFLTHRPRFDEGKIENSITYGIMDTLSKNRKGEKILQKYYLGCSEGYSTKYSKNTPGESQLGKKYSKNTPRSTFGVFLE